MKHIADAWRRHPVVSTGFALAVLITILFAVRAVGYAFYWSDSARIDQEIEGWMTPRYVAQSWRLPPEVMYTALQHDKMPGRRRTLDEIAAEQGITLEELSARIIAAATAFREASE